jgi:hypothetical protein
LKIKGGERECGSPEHPEALGLALFYQLDNLIISAYIYIEVHLHFSISKHLQPICDEADFSPNNDEGGPIF